MHGGLGQGAVGVVLWVGSVWELGLVGKSVGGGVWGWREGKGTGYASVVQHLDRAPFGRDIWAVFMRGMDEGKSERMQRVDKATHHKNCSSPGTVAAAMVIS